MKSVKAARSAAAVVVLAGFLAACASSSDGFVEEGTKDDTLEHNAIKAVMTGLGAVDPNEKPVDVKPRAPLVVPPHRELRNPVAPDSAVAANFPRNPEDIADEQRRQVGEGPGAGGRVMTPEELRRYAIPGAGHRAPADPNPGRALTPEEMAGHGKSMEEAIKRASNPSGRGTLVDPPDDYRKPSPNAPMVAPEEKSSWKPSWWPL